MYALRMFSRNKIFSTVIVIGLSVSLAAGLLLAGYVSFELRYDDFFERSRDIYRVQHDRFMNGELAYRKAMVFPEVGLSLKAQFPEVEEVGRLFPLSTNIEPVFTSVSSTGNRTSFSEANAYLADSTFCKVFDLNFIYGDGTSALAGPDRIILSQSTALRYFGRLDVIGKTLHGGTGFGNYTITGVFKDLPFNSHLKFDILMSWHKVYGDRSIFTWDGFYTYVLLAEDANVESLKGKLNTFSESYMGEFYKGQNGSSSHFYLQPLESIHLDSHLEGEMQPGGNRDVVYVLLIVAGLIILIAIINQINLTTSRSLERVKEIGVRRVVGSSKLQLIIQFMVESFLLNFTSAVIGISVALASCHYFNMLFDTHISILELNYTSAWFALSAYLIMVSLVGGLYSAFILAQTKVHEALKNMNVTPRRSGLQRILVTFQFAVSLVMVVGVFALFQQVNFMQSRNLGFGIERKLVVKMLPGVGEESDTLFNHRLNTVKNELAAISFVKSSTVSSSIPGRKNEWRGRVRTVGNGEAVVRGNLTRVDEHFINAFDLRLVAGRNYTSSFNNERSIIINAEAARQLGFSNPADALGEKIVMFRDREIIGVVESFHEAALHEEISPSMFITGEGYMKYLTISLRDGEVADQIESIRRIWAARFPDKPFEYFFLDDFFNRQYHADLIMTKCIGLFSGIAIMIACLGLFALSTYMLYRKTKEIGIKKILGASVSMITKELTMGLLIPIMGSILIAVPLAYRLVTWWLSSYAYRIELDMFIFVIPVGMIIAIAWLSIITQSFRAAQRNPTESLKHE